MPLGPDAVRSRAAGMGVTWFSSLYWSQVGEYALSITMVSSADNGSDDRGGPS